MNILLDIHQETIRLMQKYQVEFMLIGGYAVIYHGYGRTTGDMDLWLKPTNENKKKLIKAFAENGYEKDDLEQMDELNFEEHVVFSIGSEPQKIDFITRITLVEYEAAEKNMVSGEIDGITIPIIHLNDLVLSKINTGRMKDLADIEELQRIHQFPKNN